MRCQSRPRKDLPARCTAPVRKDSVAVGETRTPVVHAIGSAMKRGHRIAAWIGGLLGLLLVALVVFVATFDWNRARPTINEKASAALGRPFAIDGDLSVRWRRDRERGDWLPGPVFTAKDLRIDNPEWAHEKHFAHLEHVEFRLSLLGLLAHRISIPHVQLGRPTIHLERKAKSATTGRSPPRATTVRRRRRGRSTSATSVSMPARSPCATRPSASTPPSRSSRSANRSPSPK